MTRPRTGPLAAAAALLLSLGACGDDARPAAPGGTAATPQAPAPRGEREVIVPSKEEEARQTVLEPRDVPLAVGARAPAFAGFPAGSLAVIVFFRGEW